MRNDELFLAIGEIDDSLIENALNAVDRKRSKPNFDVKRILIAAACVGFIITALFGFFILSQMLQEPIEPPIDDTTPPIADVPNPPVEHPEVNRLQLDQPEILSYPQDPPVSGTVGESVWMGGLVVKARPLETLEDVYYRYDARYKVKYRFVLMEALYCYNSDSMVQYFYLKVEEDRFIDFLKYDIFFFDDLWQIECEDSTYYNVSDECVERMDFCVFALRAGDALAYTQNWLDVRLWEENELWETYYKPYKFETKWKRFLTEEWADIYFRDTSNHPFASFPIKEVVSLSDFTAPGSQEELAKLKDPQNGFYVQEEIEEYPSDYVYVRYRRYINGIPTDECVTVSKDGVAKCYLFSETDESKIFDILPYKKEIEQNLNQILPPNIQNSQFYRMSWRNVCSWYTKGSDGKVYGVIRVSWVFDNNDFHDMEIPRGDLIDEKYFIVSADSDECKAIGRNELLELLGVSSYVYRGEYDEFGRIYIAIAI